MTHLFSRHFRVFLPIQSSVGVIMIFFCAPARSKRNNRPKEAAAAFRHAFDRWLVGWYVHRVLQDRVAHRPTECSPTWWLAAAWMMMRMMIEMVDCFFLSFSVVVWRFSPFAQFGFPPRSSDSVIHSRTHSFLRPPKIPHPNEVVYYRILSSICIKVNDLYINKVHTVISTKVCVLVKSVCDWRRRKVQNPGKKVNNFTLSTWFRSNADFLSLIAHQNVPLCIAFA